MTETREQLIEKYKQRQKDLAQAQEKAKAQVLIKEDTKKEYDKTEKFLKNLDTIAQLVGEVLQKLTDEKN